MIEIDLITGFLGAGKTTFIREYAKYYMERGCRVCILENDFGAVNVDMLLLNDIYEQGCGLEMLAGACDKDCHRRRLKTKLISMRMLGYTRVLVEPSGIYDTEEFFDVLREEPLDEWYHIDNCIAMVDAGLEQNLNKEAEYLLTAQLCSAGAVVLGKTDITPAEKQRETVAYLNRLLAENGSQIVLAEEELVGRDYSDRFAELSECGYRTDAPKKLWFDNDDIFQTLYYLNLKLTAGSLEEKLRCIMADPACGNIRRIKGFLKDYDKEAFVQINVTEKEFSMQESAYGQEVLIVIGENLDKKRISGYMGKQADTL